MRVFVAGATGAIGQYLIPSLVADGHEVTGTTRSPSKAGQLENAGATPAVVDGLDRQAVLERGPGRAAGRHRAPDDRAGKHAQPPPL